MTKWLKRVVTEESQLFREAILSFLPSLTSAWVQMYLFLALLTACFDDMLFISTSSVICRQKANSCICTTMSYKNGGNHPFLRRSLHGDDFPTFANHSIILHYCLAPLDCVFYYLKTPVHEMFAWNEANTRRWSNFTECGFGYLTYAFVFDL